VVIGLDVFIQSEMAKHNKKDDTLQNLVHHQYTAN
jgi:hypothetical protein